MKRLVLFAAYFVLMAGAATAQQSERFDQFELHRSVVYTTFLTPEIAAEYGIARGKYKATLGKQLGDP